jgi:hypothetical protein
MVGAPSSIDMFDPKPALTKFAGQKLPESFGKIVSQFTQGDTPLMPSPWEFKQYGQSGIPVSSLSPHVAQCVDDICFVRNFYTESVVHAPAMYQVHSGRVLTGYPSMGSWVTYGLGSPADNLPAYVVMPQPEGTPEGGTPCWSAGFLPAVYQGTLLRSGPSPILHLKPPGRNARTAEEHAGTAAGDERLDSAPGDSEHAARIASYELAFKMQSAAPEAVDLNQESEATRKLYGLDDKKTYDFGSRLLLARRLIERGTRFVQIYSGGGPVSIQWDAHKDLVANHEKMAGLTDKPIAGPAEGPEGARPARRHARHLGLRVRPAADVRKRQRPGPQSARIHHVVRRRRRQGRHRWSARPTSWDSTRLGERYHMRDFHATILHLLGLDQHKLFYLHNGRNEKLTDFGGNLITKLYS